METTEYDLIVIGGGIVGTAVARDAAGRGLKVCLVEAKDLAAGTSSKSSKLIHGGLRYVMTGDHDLVKEGLEERKTLLQTAPHVVRPLDFITPIQFYRPELLVGTPIVVGRYDRLAGSNIIKPSRFVFNLRAHPAGLPLKKRYASAIQYSDAWGDDSRLVVLNAVSAAEKGADIFTRTECTEIEPVEDGAGWRVSVQDQGGSSRQITAKMAVNAAGPWAHKMLENAGIQAPDMPPMRLIKGSHIVIDRAYEGEHAYTMPRKFGKRVLFAIPFEGKTLIGTTEEVFESSPYEAEISDAERDEILTLYNKVFRTAITADDIISSYSGVRPLVDASAGRDSASLSRDYVVHEHDEFDATLLSVLGVKLTSGRAAAEEVVNQLVRAAGIHDAPPWTAGTPLPGGDMPDADFEAFLRTQKKRYDWLPPDLCQRYARAYGTCMDEFLKSAGSVSDLGRDYGSGVYQVEIDYLLSHEFAKTVSDILERRSNLYLHVSPETRQALEGQYPEID